MSTRIAMLLENPFRPDPRVHKEAKSLVQAGFEVTIFAWDRTGRYPKRERIDGIDVVRIHVASENQIGAKQMWFLLRFYRQAYKYLRQGRYDYLHCHDFPMLPLGIWSRLSLCIKAHVVYDAHEIYWIMESQKYPRPLQWFLKHLEIWLLRFVDAFITVGKIRSDYYEHLTDKPIHIVGNWYDPTTLPEAGVLKKKQDLLVEGTSFMLAYLGTLDPKRNIALLLEYAAVYPDTTVVIGGMGILEDEIRVAAAKLDNLKFLGWVTEVEIVYSAADAIFYVSNSDHPYAAYNAPNNLYLSIACQTPLITGNVGEAGHVISANQCGILLEHMDVQSLREAVCQLMNESIRLEIIQRLRKVQQRYSWHLAQDTLIRVYTS